MTTVYLVTSGEYSDYCVDAVYLDKEQAELHVERGNATEKYADYALEEWELSDKAPEIYPHFSHSAYVHKDGHLTYEHVDGGGRLASEPTELTVGFNEEYYRRWGTEPWHSTPLNVYGPDEESVEKAFADKLAEIRSWNK